MTESGDPEKQEPGLQREATAEWFPPPFLCLGDYGLLNKTLPKEPVL